MNTCCRQTDSVEALSEPMSQLWDWKLAVAAVISAQGMLFTLALSITPEPIQAIHQSYIHMGLIVSTCVTGVLLGKPLIMNAWRAFRKGLLTLEILFLASILGAFCTSLYSSIVRQGSVYYEVISIILLIYTLNKRLGAVSKTKMVQVLQRFSAQFQQVQTLTCCGSTKWIDIKYLNTESIMVIGPGALFPVASIIVSGEGFVQTASWTGDTLPVFKTVGDIITPGAYSVDAVFKVQLTSECTLELPSFIQQAVHTWYQKPSIFQNRADAIMKWFLPFVMIISVGAYIFWSLNTNWSEGILKSMSVLLVACPCALGLATPLALWRGNQLLGRRGLLVKNSDMIERLSQTDTLIFDKTGTLSLPSLSIGGFWKLPTVVEYTEALLLQWITRVEIGIDHPIAESFREVVLDPMTDFELQKARFIPGKGLQATFCANKETHEIYIGNLSLMPIDLQVSFGCVSQLALSKGCKCLLYVLLDKKPIGIVGLIETFRVGTDKLFVEAQSMGLTVEILTGSSDVATSLEQVTGSIQVVYEMTPEQKQVYMQNLIDRKQSKILYIGDGLNDMPAMATAFISMAMHTGSELSQVAADGIWLNTDFSNLVQMILLSKRIVQRIQILVISSLVYNIIAIAAAAFGYLNPILAASVMALSSLSVCYGAFTVEYL